MTMTMMRWHFAKMPRQRDLDIQTNSGPLELPQQMTPKVQLMQQCLLLQQP
jgi:hypothetical protein